MTSIISAISTLLSSAAKIVFIIMAIAVVALTWAGKVDPKDFIVLCSMAFAFYFVTPSTSSDQTTFAGK